MIPLVASVLIGGLFGSATASVDSISEDVMLIDIEVEVEPGAGGNVVAHLSFENEPDQVLSLLERDDGLYGIRTEMEPKNYFVVFEVVGDGGGSSEPVSLTEMGADLTISGTATTAADDESLDEESSRMLWLAVALGAASLSALAFWVLGGRDDDDEEREPTDTTSPDDDSAVADEEDMAERVTVSDEEE